MPIATTFSTLGPSTKIACKTPLVYNNMQKHSIGIKCNKKNPFNHFSVLNGFVVLTRLHLSLKVRAGIEMALIDAAATSTGIPLWRLFGGASNTITTDITVQF